MKKTAIFCLAVLLALTMCACSPAGSGSTYTVTKNGTDYTVDQENGTISDGVNTYQFTVSGNTSAYGINITYPDGSTYSWHTQANSNGTGFGSGGWSDDYDADRYVSGDELCDILVVGAPQARKTINPLCLLLLAVGLFNILSPRTAWDLSSGWKYKDAEPSDTALGIARLGGIICCLIGGVMLLAGLLG